ncbi:DUF3280 domain-containing protein [Methylobacterium sp. J-078]|uniref:DUF2380 domain-containing protein n=1 Tax=Methylobacterium sp. J-078 TaxID=2836657 RepID=UPI001FBA9524|nr:DUF2380 domain-containing protein [Methylobacterium sp. J-078]MCJ2045256.1 DUF3280 domain-containing protein [Methylobacterium sp. J-078]
MIPPIATIPPIAILQIARHRRVRPALLLAALVGFAVPTPARAQPVPGPDLVVLPIRLLDTSGEPQDQSVAHAERLAAMARDLASRLGHTSRLGVVEMSAEALAKACPETDAACILAQARATGARLAFVGVVHKSSTLIMQMFARLVDTASGETRIARELNFRGDNDASWQRMTAFLAREIAAAERTRN